MKLLHTLRPQSILYLCFACLTLFFASCGDDNNPVIDDGKPVNKNANVVTTDKAVLRLEFPALKKTGRQQIIVHRLSNTDYDKDRVNFCTEWDCDKKSQRWSCYQLHRGFSGNHSRTGSFTADPALSEGDYWAEYTYFPGFDRGHICPRCRPYIFEGSQRPNLLYVEYAATVSCLQRLRQQKQQE